MSKPSEASLPEEPQPHSTWFPWLVLPLARLVGFLAFLVLGPLRVKGRENVPLSGGLLILANHLADADPVVVQFACPRPLHYMAKSELFQIPVFNNLIRMCGAFPVKRGEPDRASIKHAVKLLRMGEVVCVFPEGQLSENGELQELKPGIALLARMAECQVICVGLSNTNRIMPYGKLIPRPSLRFTWAKWGQPRRFGKDTEVEEIVAWAEAELGALTSGK